METLYSSQIHDDIKALKPDVLVERYLDAKYYQYTPDEIYEMSEVQLQCDSISLSQIRLSHWLQWRRMNPLC